MHNQSLNPTKTGCHKFCDQNFRQPAFAGQLNVIGTNIMEHEIVVKRIKTRSLFKYCFVGIFTVFYPFIQLMAIFSDSDSVSFTFNGQPLYGWTAILSAPRFALLYALIFSIFIWVMLGVGTRVWAKFSSLKIQYFPLTDD